ncbi:LOW QUALITY PROTEIN: hypothetical protein HID58_095722, partial [Brassica napus]
CQGNVEVLPSPIRHLEDGISWIFEICSFLEIVTSSNTVAFASVSLTTLKVFTKKMVPLLSSSRFAVISRSQYHLSTSVLYLVLWKSFALFLCTAWFHHLPRFFWFDEYGRKRVLATVRVRRRALPTRPEIVALMEKCGVWVYDDMLQDIKTRFLQYAMEREQNKEGCSMLRQDAYHLKSLRLRFCTSFLVELNRNSLERKAGTISMQYYLNKISPLESVFLIFFHGAARGLGNLRSLNLTSCKHPTQFPDLLKATKPEPVKPSSCVNNWENKDEAAIQVNRLQDKKQEDFGP